MPVHPGGLCYIAERNSIASLADVEGLEIGAAEGDAYMVALPGLMEAAGADPSGYDFIAMSPATTTAAVVAGEIDSTPCGLPTLASRQAGAASEGLTMEFFSFADAGFDVLGFAVVANGDVSDDVVQRFVNGWTRAVRWSIDNPEAAVDAFLAANPDKTKEIELGNWANVQPLLTSDEGYFKFPADLVSKALDFVNTSYDGNLEASLFTNQFVDTLPPALIAGQLP